MGIVGIIINDEVPFVPEMNIKASFDTPELPEMGRNVHEGNSHLMEKGNTGEGIIKVMPSGDGEGESGGTHREFCGELPLHNILCSEV